MTPPATATAPSVGRPPRRGGRTSAPAQRRISGPLRGPIPASRPARRAPAPEGLVPGALAAMQRLARHRLFDRLISGRMWIAVVTFALIGIVTLQLALLRLNSSVGRSLEREGYLQRANASLAIDNSELAAGNRVESLAGKLDMQLVPLAALRFLKARPRTFTARAVASLSAPPRLAAVSSEETLASGTAAEEPTTQGSAATTTTEQVPPTDGEATGGEEQVGGEEPAGSGQASEAQTAAAPATVTQPPSRQTSSAAGSQETPSAASATGGEGSPAGGTQAGTTG